jgi:hypothetical protein
MECKKVPEEYLLFPMRNASSISACVFPIRGAIYRNAIGKQIGVPMYLSILACLLQRMITCLCSWSIEHSWLCYTSYTFHCTLPFLLFFTHTYCGRAYFPHGGFHDWPSQIYYHRTQSGCWSLKGHPLATILNRKRGQQCQRSRYHWHFLSQYRH